jgi:GGDEF domain-containing protein
MRTETVPRGTRTGRPCSCGCGSATSALWGGLDEAEESALQLLLGPGAAGRSELDDELDEVAPVVQDAIASLRHVHATDTPAEQARVERVAADWAAFQRLWRSGALAPADAAARRSATARVTSALEPATELAAAMAATEAEEAHRSQAQAEATYRAARLRIAVLSSGSMLVCLLIALALIRNLVPRLQSYSGFAGRVADGQLGERLTPRGADEVAQLGRALDLMVRRREEQRAYEEAQAEFADAMQLSETEGEAHDLLKRHLERAIEGSRVTVLNRNNSADRLEAATPVEPECPLHTSLQGAKPRACLAVRFGRAHQGGPAHEPLLVSGQVIGSVLVNHPAGTDIGPPIRDSVTQAAPVLANLRNLAIAEIRAATDALTGLPNNRAVQDTLRRMVAQASRTMSPLSAALLDLDHFKHINDAHGHSRGDEALAAVAANLRSSLRESDFVGRYGGEEFLILLPDTGKQQARIVAERCGPRSRPSPCPTRSCG